LTRFFAGPGIERARVAGFRAFFCSSGGGAGRRNRAAAPRRPTGIDDAARRRFSQPAALVPDGVLAEPGGVRRGAAFGRQGGRRAPVLRSQPRPPCPVCILAPPGAAAGIRRVVGSPPGRKPVQAADGGNTAGIVRGRGTLPEGAGARSRRSAVSWGPPIRAGTCSKCKGHGVQGLPNRERTAPRVEFGGDRIDAGCGSMGTGNRHGEAVQDRARDRRSEGSFSISQRAGHAHISPAQAKRMTPEIHCCAGPRGHAGRGLVPAGWLAYAERRRPWDWRRWAKVSKRIPWSTFEW